MHVHVGACTGAFSDSRKYIQYIDIDEGACAGTGASTGTGAGIQLVAGACVQITMHVSNNSKLPSSVIVLTIPPT